MLPGLPEFGNPLYKSDRLRYFTKNVLPNFDIVCCQEIFLLLNDRKQSVINYAHHSGFPFHARSVLPNMLHGFLPDGGLLTLSRFPILESEFKPFPYGVFSDSCANKGVLYTKIDVKGEILHLFNTHMQATYFSLDSNHAKASVETRELQVAMVRDFINQKVEAHARTNKEPGLVLLAGDLNIDSSDSKVFLNRIRDGIAKERGLTEEDERNLKYAESEYKNTMEILSNFGREKIVDCFKENQENSEFKVTYSDTIEVDGRTEAREWCLTNPDDCGLLERLDYIFWIDPSD